MKQTTEHVVTLEWLKKHATARGGYTKAQMQALGLAWPPVAGWQKAAVGMVVPMDHAQKFEAASGKAGGQ